MEEARKAVGAMLPPLSSSSASSSSMKDDKENKIPLMAVKQKGQHGHGSHGHSHHKCCNRNHGPAAGNHALPTAGLNGNATPAGSSSSSSSGLTLAQLQAMPPTELAQLQAALKQKLAMQLAAQQQQQQQQQHQQQQQQSAVVSATTDSSATNPTPAAAATTATAAAAAGGGGGGGGNRMLPTPLALDINPAAVSGGGGSSGSSTSNGALATPPPSMDIFEAVKLGLVSIVKRLVQEQEAQAKQQQQQQQQPASQGGGGRAPSPSSNGSVRAFLSQRDGDGHTLMHWAAKRGDLDLVRFLAEKGAPLFETSADSVGMEPIHWAVTDGHLPVLHYLVSKGADLNARDKQLCTPLLIAAQYGQTEVVAYLVKNGADTTLLDTNNDSSMHWAAYKGELSIVQLLDHLGLPTDDVDGYGQTPLHLAALRGNLPVVEYLVLDADAQTERKDKNGSGPYDLAVKKGQRKVAAFLQSQALEKFEWRQLFSIQHWRVWLVQGGGNAEGSSWPFMLVIVSNLWVHLMYPLRFFTERGLGALVSHTRLNAWCVALQLSMWVFFLLAWKTDPGWIEGGREGRRREYDEALETFSKEGMERVLQEAAAEKGHFHHQEQQQGHARSPRGKQKVPLPNLCHSCHVLRPVRSKHCRVCRKCVHVFDHHCPFIGNCVGVGNYRWFFLYVVNVLMATLLFITTSIIYLKHAGFDLLVFGTLLYILSFALMVGALAVYHTQLIALNLTTNEHQNYWRYDYFKDPLSGRSRNPFDKGVWQNLLARVVYGETYERGVGAGPSGGGGRGGGRTREEEGEMLLAIV